MRITQKIVFCFFFLLFIMGCKHDKSLEPGSGEISATLNSKYWSSSNVHVLNSNLYGFEISGDVYNKDDLLRESLFLNHISKNYIRNFFSNTTYNFDYKDSLTVGFFTSIDDGDVGCDSYMIIDKDSANNFIQITWEKHDYSEISGIFSATLIRTDSCSADNYPDTLRFRDGKFHVRLK